MTSTKTKIDIKDEILELARAHHVSYEVGPHDEFAQTMSYLAGNRVKLDATGKLIVALQRAGVITRQKAVMMQAEYMRQAKP